MSFFYLARCFLRSSLLLVMMCLALAISLGVAPTPLSSSPPPFRLLGFLAVLVILMLICDLGYTAIVCRVTLESKLSVFFNQSQSLLSNLESVTRRSLNQIRLMMRF